MILVDRPRARLLLSALCLASLLGCSRQKEGERCSLLNGDSDCEDDLVCTEAETLRSGEDLVDRCCPEAGEASTDSRCALRTTGTPGGSGGSSSGIGGEGGGGGQEGDDATKGVGADCDYNSECELPLVCGPGGVCQFECNRDRDCGSNEVCADQTCVPG